MTRDELMNLTDDEIVDFLISNNSIVIQYLFYDKCRSMFTYISKEIFSCGVARDELISELYIYLRANDWAKVRGFEGRSKLTTWLSVVAVRFFLKKRDEILILRNSETIDDIDKNIVGSMSYNSFISKIDIYTAIRQLKSPRDRFVIMSSYIDGKEDKEIATEICVTIDNLYNIRKRARTQLFNMLKDS